MDKTRRGMIAALALSPVAISLPAIAAPSTFSQTHAAFIHARTTLDEAPAWLSEEEYERIQDIYMEHYKAMNEAVPTTPREFMQMFHALWTDGGVPNEREIEAMLCHAGRLLS